MKSFNETNLVDFDAWSGAVDTKISYRIGYYVFVFAEKINNKWVNL